MISVVIPAHDEASVLPRCLSALFQDARTDELEVVVVCNGCQDDSADVARAFDGPVTVIETDVASKTHALNLGDDAAKAFPRFYVDADIELSTRALREVTTAIETGHPAASPASRTDLSKSTWPVRAFYRVWQETLYYKEGMIGCGVYALSEEGRGRFGPFPDLIGDDAYVRAHFTNEERASVASHPVGVHAPRTLWNLIKAKTRSRLGLYQLRERHPDLLRSSMESNDHAGSMRSILRQPRLWTSFPIYVLVNVVARLRAQRQLRRGNLGWERDDSTRGRDQAA